MSCNIENSTITFDDRVKGWTSFHSFYPDFMASMNGNLYSFKNGDLYEHDSDEVPRNTFYGVQYPSKVSLMVNDAPSTIKELQAVSLEGNYSWDSLITAFVSNTDDTIISTIKEVEFVKKEGIWFAYARRNESDNSFDSKSTYGIGVVSQVAGNTVIVNGWSDTLTFGDDIVKGSNLTTIGSIQSISRTSVTTLVLDNTTGLSVGDFILGKKDSRTEGGKLRGYTLRIDLEIEKDNKVELFSVNSEVIKSFQ